MYALGMYAQAALVYCSSFKNSAGFSFLQNELQKNKTQVLQLVLLCIWLIFFKVLYRKVLVVQQSKRRPFTSLKCVTIRILRCFFLFTCLAMFELDEYFTYCMSGFINKTRNSICVYNIIFRFCMQFYLPKVL